MEQKNFLYYLIGEYPLPMMVAAFVWACVGAILSLLYDAVTRDIEPTKKSANFSWSFLHWDNIQRIWLNLLLIIVYIRFSPELLGSELSMYLALIIGIGFDQLGLKLKKNKLLDNRDKKRTPPPTE